MILSAPPISPQCPRTTAIPPFEGSAPVGQSLEELHDRLGVSFADEDLDTWRQVLAVERGGLEGTAARSPITPLSVLLVDDNVLVAKLLAVLLRLDGHAVHIARNGFTALKCVRTYRPQVVLLDIDLPDISGYEVAFRLRSRLDAKNIFLAAVTGYGHRENRDQYVEAGFDCHLSKPVDAVDLRRLLASISSGGKEVH